MLHKNLLKKILYVFTGCLIGFGYYYFIGCRTGSCPITSSPLISTIYGAIAGLILSFTDKKKGTENGK